ncbi:MAG TPA: 1-acyl-sn-glycerol-3-phosphate acyltransferase [Planctomycetota bacterium]|nr:1-acyl-sn-glycerol-3-phosphate acyltransferase [Planctomycetota bacterium]
MTGLWWRLTRFLAWIAVRCYYGSFRVEGVGRIPVSGPALFVLNHPNSLLDPAVLILSSPRPIHFAAKGPLFRTPGVGFLLRRLGAIPIDRPSDAGSDLRRNLGAFARMAEVLKGGGACAIFPEGLSHLDPELKAVKSGPARVAIEAEESAGWALGLRVVPVGLTFHPRQQFRGEVIVRVGEPFPVGDLKGENRHRAVRTVQGRIADSLKPLVHHLDRTDLAPLVARVADLVAEERRDAAPAGPPLTREEIERIAGEVLNHTLVADPSAVDAVAKDLHRYERLAGRTGVTEAAVRARRGPVAAFARWAGLGLLLVLGSPLYLAGVLVGLVPYKSTDAIARSLVSRSGGPTALPMLRVVCGVLVFGAWWGGLSLLVLRWSSSRTVTAVFAALLPALGLFARWYWLHARGWAERSEALLPAFARRRAVARAGEVRAEIVARLRDLARRTEEATGRTLVPETVRAPRRRLPWKRTLLVAAGAYAAWFAAGLRGKEFALLAAEPSPWATLAADDARAATERDALSLAAHLDTLETLAATMKRMGAGFDSGDLDFYDPATDAALRGALLSYLNCREGLFKIAWFYREPDRPEPELRDRAVLLGTAAAAELIARGMQLVDAQDGHPDAIRKLNEGDPAGGIPPGAYDRIRRNLADSDALDALAASDARRKGIEPPREDPWPRISARADRASADAAALAERLWKYKWESAVTRAVGTGQRGRYAAGSVVSAWIGDARVRKRPHGGGLVSQAQVDAFRARLKPGDVLIERRNWYLSNAFLPGFWKHAALFTGGAEGLRSLGIAGDAAVAARLPKFEKPDADGHPVEVLEAVSEGVILTSLEHSIGGADAVCALRPRLPPEAVAAAMSRAMAQEGKPYDFDFDFFSTDKLVCTEVVYQAYQGPIRFPLVEIMGRRTLPALEIVKMWDEGRGKPEAPFDFVAFLDGDEVTGTAREAGEEELRESITRSGLTLLQEDQAGRPLLMSPWVAALAAASILAFFLFPRRPQGPVS